MGTIYNVDATTGNISTAGSVTTAGGIVSTSTTTGFLPPRLTTTQRDAIVSPATGLQIFNTTTVQDEFYNGSVWGAIGGSIPAGSNTQIQYNNSGTFGADSGFTWNGTLLGLNTGGSITLTTVNSGSIQTGGNITITTGDSTGDECDGGIVTLTSGNSSATFSNGTNLTLTSGNGASGSTGGNLTLTSGSIGTTRGGSLILTAGFDSNNGGNIYLEGNGETHGQIGVGTSSPDTSASVDIQSTSRGFLPPRMTTTQKNAISSPATGLVVYDTTLNQINIYNGTSWNSGSGITSVKLTAQPSAIGTTTLFTPTSTGVFRVSVYIVDTAAGSAGTVSATIGWTDDEQAQTISTSTVPLATLGAFTQSTFFIEATSGNAITYSTAFAGAIGSPMYSLYVTVERLS